MQKLWYSSRKFIEKMATKERTKGTEGMLAQDMKDISIFNKKIQYEGVTLLGVQSPWIYEGIKTWEARYDDVFLVVYPRSGTHWVFEIVSLIMCDLDLDKIDRTHMQFALDMVLAHSEEGLETITPGYKAMDEWPSPRVIVTYMLEEFAPPQIKNKKIIVWNRNPKDIAVSYYKFLGESLPDEIKEWENFLKYFLSEEMFGGSWFRHVNGWWQHEGKYYRDNMLFCKYEDFQKDLKGGVKRIADFLWRPLTDEQLDKVVALTRIDGMRKTYDKIEENLGDTGKTITRMFGQLPYLRKGRVGGWKDKFKVGQDELFNKVYEEKMKDANTKFEFEI